MKKIIFYLCFFALFGCGGYEPLFSTKNLSFYIEDVKNVNNDFITKKISRNLDSNKIKINNKKNYILEISSSKEENITSKNSKGEVLTYEMIINVEVKVFFKNVKFPFSTLRFKENFNYSNQGNKFDLSQYKKKIERNLIDKISQEILIKLQSI